MVICFIGLQSLVLRSVPTSCGLANENEGPVASGKCAQLPTCFPFYMPRCYLVDCKFDILNILFELSICTVPDFSNGRIQVAQFSCVAYTMAPSILNKKAVT